MAVWRNLCLTFFREGCSPAAPLDDPPLLRWILSTVNFLLCAPDQTPLCCGFGTYKDVVAVRRATVISLCKDALPQSNQASLFARRPCSNACSAFWLTLLRVWFSSRNLVRTADAKIKPSWQLSVFSTLTFCEQSHRSAKRSN